MNVLEELASAKGRRDERPNVLLARRLATGKEPDAISTLVDALEKGTKAIQGDAIKVLYEIGEVAPSLITPHTRKFAALLQHPNNRLAWGAMTALDAIASERPADVHAYLDDILAAAGSGSVITRDHAVAILVRLCGVARYRPKAFGELLRMLKSSPVNQLPMYAERVATVSKGSDREALRRLLDLRVKDLQKDSQKKRLLKVLKGLAS